MSFRDTDKECVLHSKSDNIVMTYDKADEVIKELLESVLYRYQTGLERSVKSSGFVFIMFNFCITPNLSGASRGLLWSL